MMNEALRARFSDTAMVLAAGFGTRLRPLTLEKPKPLVEVGGRALLDRALDALLAAGVARVVVNGHYLADQIETHVAARPEKAFVFSREETILDTGGGVKKARAYFGDKPFFFLNADSPWIDGSAPALERLAAAWDSTKMDVLLLLYPTAQAHGFYGTGDFMMEPDGRVWRQGAPQDKPFVWISVGLVAPALYDEIDETVFSNNKIFNLAESRRRLYGLLHDGTCYQITTPQDFAEANRRLLSGEGWG